jgi:hypothetical protein
MTPVDTEMLAIEAASADSESLARRKASPSHEHSPPPPVDTAGFERPAYNQALPEEDPGARSWIGGTGTIVDVEVPAVSQPFCSHLLPAADSSPLEATRDHSIYSPRYACNRSSRPDVPFWRANPRPRRSYWSFGHEVVETPRSRSIGGNGWPQLQEREVLDR